ncbi:hypothetical protein MSG28_003431 [Choristoneura fumiferana]|uniref:Uncharacterized protein n=1 Tax=Choristoneura fumiferana TaxID=7141 RepID=A0ACC0KFA5_CHOFU|nr:hypothetical protein MSG28_003431 [Choristoneura fumiferana]
MTVYSKLKVAFKKYPLLRGMASYSVIWPLSSLIQQSFEGKNIRWCICLAGYCHDKLLPNPSSEQGAIYQSSKKKQKHLKHEYPKFDVTNHPLKLNIVTTKPSPSTSFIENLNKWTSPFEEIDPLLRFEQMELNEDPTPAEPIADDSTNYSKAWISRRAVILNKYTTGEKLTIISSFLPGGEKALIRQVSNLNEKVKHRLEQLDDFDEDSVRKTMGLSQQEFVNKINCSKLLSDVNVMQFYPSKFVLITDILDKFGNLVFARLKDRSYGPNVVKSHQDIDPSEVPEAAKETCQNWLFKMASIRELLPRLYMEMSLLKCYTFISKENIKPAIARITLMIRGIGNPLVATYLRLYLCKVAANLLGNECEEFFHSNLKEFLEEYQQIFHPALRKKFEVQLLTLDKYLSLYIPAVDWLMYGTVNSTKCKLTLLEGLLQQCEEMENKNGDVTGLAIITGQEQSIMTQHVNIILRGTIRYMIKCGKPADEFSGNFQFVLRRMLNSIPDVEELFLMDAFMPLVELVQTSNARTMMAKTVLSIFFTKYKLVKIEDHIDEVKLCADLITKYIHAVDYHDDLEQQLNFYVESRAAFIKLDAVLSVNALAARGARASRGWLQRACAAYCFVTAPLIPDIPEFVIEDGQKKMTHIKDNMDSNVKAYILSGFIKTIERIHWRKTDPLYYMSLLHTLDLLCEMTHENYAYSIDGVISNDKLYGSDEEYIESIENYSSNITQEILVVLKALADSKETRKQYELALELFWRVIRRGDLEDNSMANLAANLWMLSRKLQDSNQRVSISMLLALKNDKTKLLIWTICQAVFASEDKEKGFVQPLDFAPIFDGVNSGLTSLASNPIAAALLKVDKSQYPQLFDTVVSSSLDSLQKRVAPQDTTFAYENFGFNPIASQSFLPPAKAARLVAPPAQRPAQAAPYQRQQFRPLYDIRTVHDADYKVYKPEENEQGEILAALKQNPSVAGYFKPAVTNLEIAHPLKYRKEELLENPEAEQNYKPNGYIAGPPRLRRYTGERRRENLKKSSDEEEDPYDYRSEYISRPKAFDSGTYSSAYKEEKDPNKDYEYPYGGYDSGYDHKEYERIKELSEKQAAEIKQNPGNCKQVNRDGMTCSVCKDPKTGGNYESCSYVAEPKNNKYAYSKEKKFDSNDEPDEPEAQGKDETPRKSAKYVDAKEDEKSSEEYAKLTAPKEESEEDDSKDKYKAYYVHSSKPTPSEALRAASDESSEEKAADPLVKPYNYKQALPEFYTDNEPKKDVEHVLAEFKKKDRSTCKKVQKNGMTCFQCVDKNGLKNEECMFVSESAPKRSHLAYQELKEFQSQPAVPDSNNVGAESKIVTTNSPPVQKSAAYVVANSGYGKKLKRKKAVQGATTAAATSPVASAVAAASAPVATATPLRPKRSVDSEAEARAEIADESELAPEEFAGDSSKGAYWAETMPRYSAALGVTLPEFMLSRSEHEASFDETVAGV